jgi:hypothetical protein
MDHFDDSFMQHVVGEPGYDLESNKLALIPDYEYDSKIGWMSSYNMSDLSIYRFQDYGEERDSGDLYFEFGYVGRGPISDDFLAFTEEDFLI